MGGIIDLRQDVSIEEIPLVRKHQLQVAPGLRTGIVGQMGVGLENGFVGPQYGKGQHARGMDQLLGNIGKRTPDNPPFRPYLPLPQLRVRIAGNGQELL